MGWRGWGESKSAPGHGVPGGGGLGMDMLAAGPAAVLSQDSKESLEGLLGDDTPCAWGRSPFCLQAHPATRCLCGQGLWELFYGAVQEGGRFPVPGLPRDSLCSPGLISSHLGTEPERQSPSCEPSGCGGNGSGGPARSPRSLLPPPRYFDSGKHCFVEWLQSTEVSLMEKAR